MKSNWELKCSFSEASKAALTSSCDRLVLHREPSRGELCGGHSTMDICSPPRTNAMDKGSHCFALPFTSCSPFLTVTKRHSVGASQIIGANSRPLCLVCCHGRRIECSPTQIESSRGSARADLCAGNGLLSDLLRFVVFTRRFERQSKSGAMHFRHLCIQYCTTGTSRSLICRLRVFALSLHSSQLDQLLIQQATNHQASQPWECRGGRGPIRGLCDG